MSQANQGEHLLQILVSGGLISREDVSDCKFIARDLKIPVIQAIKTSGLISEHNLSLCQAVLGEVERQTITVDLAVRAVRIANQKGTDIETAIREAKEIHEVTKVNIFEANELTKLLLSSHIINSEQYSKTMIKVRSQSMMLGQALIVDELITTEGLLAALNAILMMRDSGLSEANAVTGLRYACKKDISFEQALFELGSFIPPDAKTIRIGEFFLMAGLITRADLAECIEIQLFKKKQFSQILLERGLTTQEHLQTAVDLLSQVSNNTLRPYQAAEALRQICTEGKNKFEVIASLQQARPESNTRLGDMLVDATIMSRPEIEKAITENMDSAIRVGSTLMRLKLIDERTLYAALRLQTSVRLGYLERDRSIKLLRDCIEEDMSIEESLAHNDVFVPGRMQWTWV